MRLDRQTGANVSAGQKPCASLTDLRPRGMCSQFDGSPAACERHRVGSTPCRMQPAQLVAVQKTLQLCRRSSHELAERCLTARLATTRNRSSGKVQSGQDERRIGGDVDVDNQLAALMRSRARQKQEAVARREEDAMWLLGLHRSSLAAEEDQLYAYRAPPPAAKPRQQPLEFTRTQQAVLRLLESNSGGFLRAEDGALRMPPRGFSPAADLLNNRQVLLMGDSTVRDVLSAITDTPKGEPWAVNRGGASGFWTVRSLGCEPRVGSGCADCWACCFDACAPMAAMRGGRHGMISYSKRVANARYSRRSWQDYEFHREEGNTTVAFSWKPELHTPSDGVAFRERFCASPPDVIYLGKGLHDACRHHVDSIAAHSAHAERHMLALAQTLRCLPKTALVVLRTPYYVTSEDDGPSGGGSRRVCNNATWEPQRVRVVRDVMVKLHRAGAFGTALLLDAFMLTEAASRIGSDAALRSLDGHHYPFAIRQIELYIVWYAYQELHRRSRLPIHGPV
jgi:hypothetical protein